MKHLLITGGTSGIGLNFLKRFGSEFDKISVCGRTFIKLDQLQVRCEKYEIDFGVRYQDYDFVENIEPITHAVFATGYVENIPIKFHDSRSTVDQLNVNLVSQLNLFGELFKLKKFKVNGSVVFIGSLLGPSIGMPAGLSYAASKAGLIGAVKVMALEAAKRNIRVNAVSPGMVETPLTDNLVLSNELIEADKNRYPLGKKYLSMDEVSSVVKFLLDPTSQSITGQNIIADRGFTLQ